MPKSQASSKEKKPARARKSVEPVDESQWRASRIGQNRKARILHTRLLVTAALLESLPFTTSSVSGKNKIVSIMFYCEREVELLAWRKHGGPEGFEDYIDKLRKKHMKKQPEKEFKVPEVYKQAEADTGLIQLAPPRFGAASGSLRPLRQLFVESGRLWLWEAANDVLAASGGEFGDERLSSRQKEAALSDPFLTDPHAYPLRPAFVAPASPSYIEFRQVLARAPSKHNRETRGQLQLNDDIFQGETIYHWKQDYMVELFDSLIAIIIEHGIEGIGWKSARWEVYYTYARCIRSLYFSYADNSWHDDAKDWLHGRMELGSSGTLTPRQDNKSELGKIYNKMLPLLQSGE
ncbi:hypothetical protein C8F04DRAFT_1336168 [Mycena alexandri]|uniref:Uncharacterized protein n=1 Tax=Mycena alexandri TaxID=1745969 RepID=A0AAD6SZ38_9AGAR|nr:hypothetical protein C8F04DRAFT_1336168 [Mycena alexandri]